MLLTCGTLFFSLSCVSLHTFSRSKLYEICKAGNRRNDAKIISDKAEQLILASSLYRLVLNMLILLLLIAFFSAEKTSAPAIGDYAAAFAIAAIIFIIFSLAVPHAWAKYAAEKTLLHTCKILIVFAFAAAPLIYFVKIYDGLVRRLAGVPQPNLEEDHEEKQEEFLTDLEEHRIEGVVDTEEKHMIEKVLELSEKTANEIMTPRTDIIALRTGSDLTTTLDTITKAGHSRIPVYENNIDNIIGFIYAKDLLGITPDNIQNFKLREKIRQPFLVPETKTLRKLLREFKMKKKHIAVILDEYGGTSGLVTLEDILEELVGEISDEYEIEEPQYIKIMDEKNIDVDARTAIDDLNDQCELNLPEDEDYDSIGGFVLSYLGYIPKTGETFDTENLRFTITSAQTRKINRIRIRKIDENKNVD